MIDWRATRAAVETVSGKWTLVVLAELAEGDKGYNELAIVTQLNHKAMDRTLHRLESAQLVDRHVNVERSRLRVQYSLTSRARCLLGPLDELARWWHASF